MELNTVTEEQRRGGAVLVFKKSNPKVLLNPRTRDWPPPTGFLFQTPSVYRDARSTVLNGGTRFSCGFTSCLLEYPVCSAPLLQHLPWPHGRVLRPLLPRLRLPPHLPLPRPLHLRPLLPLPQLPPLTRHSLPPRRARHRLLALRARRKVHRKTSSYVLVARRCYRSTYGSVWSGVCQLSQRSARRRGVNGWMAQE